MRLKVNEAPRQTKVLTYMQVTGTRSRFPYWHPESRRLPPPSSPLPPIQKSINLVLRQHATSRSPHSPHISRIGLLPTEQVVG